MKNEWKGFAPAGKSLEEWDTAEETGDRRNCRPDRPTNGSRPAMAGAGLADGARRNLNGVCSENQTALVGGKNIVHKHGHTGKTPATMEGSWASSLSLSEREVRRPHSLPDTPGRSRGTGEANLNIHQTKAALNKSPVESEPGPEPKERKDTP